MNQFAARLLAAAVMAGLASSAAFAAPAITGAAPPAAPAASASEGQLARIDGEIQRADGLTRELESLAKGGADGSGCPAALDDDAFYRNFKQDLKSGEFPRPLLGRREKDLNRIDGDWQLYHLCLAIGLKNAGACGDIPDVTPPPAAGKGPSAYSAQQDCALVFRLVPMYRAYDARSPGFEDACVAAASERGGWSSPAALRAMCRAIAAAPDNPEAAVAAARAARGPSATRADALSIVQDITGDPKACGVSDDGYVQTEICRERASAHAAARTRNPQACSGALCRVLLGGSAAECGGYLSGVRKAACKAYYTPRYARDSAKLFQGIQDKVVAGLDGAVAGDVKQAQAVNRRLDRIFELRERFDAAEGVLAPFPPGDDPASKAARAAKRPSR